MHARPQAGLVENPKEAQPLPREVTPVNDVASDSSINPISPQQVTIIFEGLKYLFISMCKFLLYRSRSGTESLHFLHLCSLHLLPLNTTTNHLPLVLHHIPLHLLHLHLTLPCLWLPLHHTSTTSPYLATLLPSDPP